MMENQTNVHVTLQAAETDEHFEGILQLQQQNLYKLISSEQQANNGFVFAEHNLQLLKAMAAQLPQVIALHEGKVIGYNLSMTADMQNEIPSLIPMFAEFNHVKYLSMPLTTYSYIVGGQVCVD